jgi:hypothetical protein
VRIFHRFLVCPRPCRQVSTIPSSHLSGVIHHPPRAQPSEPPPSAFPRTPRLLAFGRQPGVSMSFIYPLPVNTNVPRL